MIFRCMLLDTIKVSYMFQVLAGILYKAAREHSYVDPEKVQQILDLPREKATDTDGEKIHEAKGKCKIHLNVHTSSLLDKKVISRKKSHNAEERKFWFCSHRYTLREHH